MNDVASRVVLAWCRAYTVGAPPEARDRRREEIASFLIDLRAAGVAKSSVVRGALVGCVDDLRWCSTERTIADLPPVSMTVSGAVTIAAALSFTAYAVTLPHLLSPLPFGIASTLVLLLAYGRTWFVWRRRRSDPLSAYSLTDLSSQYTVGPMTVPQRLFEHPLRIYRWLVPVLVVAFLASGVGQNGKAHGHDATYRFAATAWAIAWLAGLITILFSFSLLAYRARRRR